MKIMHWWQKKSNTFKGFILGIPTYYVLILIMDLGYLFLEFLRGWKGPYTCIGINVVNCSFLDNFIQSNEILLIFVAIWAIPLFMILGGGIGFTIDSLRRIRNKK